jgi:hypothetical protein
MNHQLIRETHLLMEEQYPNYHREQTERLGEMYLNCIDKKGFFIPFSEVWSWVGYTLKRNAKRRMKTDLKEGVDWIILDDNRDYKEMSNRRGKRGNSVVLFSEQQKTKAKTTDQGGRNYENIMMTSKAFAHFCLAARTSEGQMLRDFVIALSIGVKRLGNEIAAGRIELRRIDDPNRVDTDVKRLKVCETNKALMAEIGATGLAAGCIYAKVNGVTNKLVTGRYRYETAKLLGKKSKSVNARDHFTPGQLAAAELSEILSKQRIKENPGCNALEQHTAAVANVMENIKGDLHGKILEKPRSLRDIRKKRHHVSIEDQGGKQGCTKIEDKKSVEKSTIVVAPKKQRITNYFSANSVVVN